jgi:DMSO/TMAO reductase YedYZ molybdopterin-dependent catalytic subunit
MKRFYSLRLALLCVVLFAFGLLLQAFVYTPGYCLDPPVVTPIDGFFIEHNGGEVQTAPADWRLSIEGLVAQPLSLTIEDIMKYPSQTYMGTIECGGNPFAFKVRELIGNGVWTGVPVRTILDEAGPLGNAASVVFTGLDGYTARLSLDDIYQRDDIMLAYGMNGETLPPEQGYPLRLTIPGINGSMWVQWLTTVEISSQQPSGTLSPIPPHCQIFSPVHDQVLNLSTQKMYGMALAGEVEIAAVEVSTDGGASWQPATILTEYVPNAWRHWGFEWTPPAAGTYTLSVRAIDSSGNVQPSPGFYGWNIFSITVTVDRIDDPPQITAGPVLVGSYMPPSTDPGNPTVLEDGARLIWTYDDDRASCSGGCRQSWQYRPSGIQDWVTGDALFGWFYGFVDLPIDEMGAGFFDLRIAVTDCAEQSTYSDVYYVTIESFDSPPEITWGPVLVGSYLPPSADPDNPTVLEEGARLIWTYDDDRATCSGACRQNWQYRLSGAQNWITGDALFGWFYGFVDVPVDEMGAGFFDLRIAVTDCAEQTAYSDTYYVFIE